MSDFVAHVIGAVRSSVFGFIINTFEGIDAPYIAKIRHELSLPAFTVGLLHLLSRASAEQTTMCGCARSEDRCLVWLEDTAGNKEAPMEEAGSESEGRHRCRQEGRDLMDG